MILIEHIFDIDEYVILYTTSSQINKYRDTEPIPLIHTILYIS